MASVVYIATNRENGKRYIGVTQRGFAKRRSEHEKAPRAARITCRAFHRAMAKYGPDAFEWGVLASFDAFEEALSEEIRLIAELKPEYNLTTGGQGTRGHRMTQEGRARWREKMVGRKMPPEFGAAISARQTGNKRTNELRDKVSAARKGMKFSDTHRLSLSLSHKGHRPSAETIEKRRAAMIGRPLTDEHKEKIRKARTGVPRPPGVIKKMRDGLAVYLEAKQQALL
jgi:group I intron endonuclease